MGVLTGIAHATERLPVITGVTCPMIRIHPAVVAQAAATAAASLFTIAGPGWRWFSGLPGASFLICSGSRRM